MLYNVTHLVNFISSYFLKLKLYHMSLNGNDALNVLDSGKIDIILLDLNLPDLSGIDILKYIEDNEMNQYYNSIIVISEYINSYKSLLSNPYIFSYINKPASLDLIFKDLKKIILEKTSIDNQGYINFLIEKELKYLCFDFSHIGTQYLQDTIFYTYISKNYTINLSKKYIQ